MIKNINTIWLPWWGLFANNKKYSHIGIFKIFAALTAALK